MKTAKEITTAIETKRENERQELVKWAIELINQASEEMFQKLSTSSAIRVIGGKYYCFSKALEQEELQKFISENGFVVTTEDFCYYLKVK